MGRKKGVPSIRPENLQIVVSIRLHPKQDIYIKKISKLILQTTDVKVTRTWVIKKMMAFGQDRFHKEFGIDFEMIENVNLEDDVNLKILKRR